MRLQSLHIHAFGHFVDAAIPSLPHGLIVVCAENGGGKTTLRDFVRAALFGFTREDRNRYAVDGSHSHGGTLQFVLRDGGLYQLSFDAKRNKSTVKALAGEACPEPGILLGSDSPQLYRNVFAIGLHELQDARYLDDEKVQTMIGAFGSGQSGQVFQTARNSLTKETEQRFKQGGSVPRANKLMSELKTLQDELKRLRAESEAYWEYERRLDALNQEIEEASEREKDARARHHHLGTLVTAWPDWIGLNGVKAQLAALVPAVEEFPLEGSSQLKSLNDRLSTLREALADRTAELEKSREELGRLVPAPKLLEAGAEIDAASERFAVYEQNLEHARKAGDDLRSIVARQQAEMAKLGPDWDAARLEGFNDDVASQSERASAIRQLNEAESEVKARETVHDRLTRDYAARKEAADSARAAFAQKWTHTPATQKELDERASALSTVRSRLAEIARLEDKNEQFRREHAAATAEAEALRGRVAGPAAAPPPAGGLYPLRSLSWVPLVAGVLLAGLLYQNPAAAALVIVLGIGAFIFFLRYHVIPSVPAAAVDQHGSWFEGQLAAWQSRAEEAKQALAAGEQSLAAAQAELATLCQLFGRILTDADCSDVHSKLLAAAEARRQWEQAESQVLALEEAARTSGQQLEAAIEELNAARNRLQAASGRWCAWLRAHGLAEELSPEAAEAVCRQVNVARNLVQEAQIQKEALARLQQQVDAYLAAVERLFTRVQRPAPAAADMAGALRSLREERDAARECERQRETLTRNIPDQETAVQRAAAALNACNAEKQALLQAGGASGDDEFMARAVAWARREELLARQRGHMGRLEVLSGPGEAVQRMLEELAGLDKETLDSGHTLAGDELSAAEERVKQLSREHGQLMAHCERLARSDDVSSCNAKIESLAAELNDVAEEWAVRRVAQLLMGRARDKFETERQPAVLRSAGSSLATMTGGRITRIVKPLEGGKYRLTLANGESLGDDLTWNTAMKEQTYLSLRFGLIDAYCEKSEPLPIILDDALVNLDPRHLQGAVNCIGELAKRHQVIYLTCHPHTMACFAALDEKPEFYSIRDRVFHPVSHQEFVQV